MNQLRGKKRTLPFASMGLVKPRTMEQCQEETESSDCACECKRLCQDGDPHADNRYGEIKLFKWRLLFFFI